MISFKSPHVNTFHLEPHLDGILEDFLSPEIVVALHVITFLFATEI